MTTYYIDPSAGVNGNGAFETPFNTWASVTWAAGNTYLQKAGTTFTGKVTVSPTTAGVNESERITLGMYGEGDKPKINGDGSDRCISVSIGKNYVTVQDFELYGPNIGTRRCISFGSNSTNVTNFVTIKRCVIHDPVATTADVNGISGFGSNFEISENLIYNIPTDGVWIQGSNGLVERNVIYDIGTDGRAAGDCVQLYGDATLAGGNWIVRNNNFDHLTGSFKQALIVQDTGSATGCIVENNILTMAAYDSVTTNNTLFVEVPGAIVRNNKIYGGRYGIFLNESNVQVYGNLVKTIDYGIVQGATATGCVIVNNTIDDCGYGIYADTDTTATVKNNIVYGCTTGTAMETGENEDYNCYYGNTTAKTTLGGVAAWGSNSITSDPLLLSNYTIPQNSPCAAAGVFISFDITDFDGHHFHYPPSIGGFECLYQHIERLGDNGAITYAVGNPDLTMPTISGAGYLQNRVAKIIADGTANATSSRLTLEGKLRAKVGGG